MAEGWEIAPLSPSHWKQVRQIYLQGIAGGHATFETECPDWETWDKAHLPHCRRVALQEGQVAGWAALSPVSGRCVYRGVAEASVYVRESQRGSGIGSLLLGELVQASEQAGIWTLEAGVFPENKASLALFSRHGFRELGVRERLGKLNGVWRNVVFLERRSTVAGGE
ncbi:MAG: GNAT family N-acetyltransferase [Planctomycetota bacterium]|jgi:phosphinothricin acetyltransferase